MATYSYTISTDTANAAVDIPTLTQEILGAALPQPPAFGGVSVSGDALAVMFDPALTAGEETTLGTTVSAHQGAVDPSLEASMTGPWTASSDGSAATSSTSFVDVGDTITVYPLKDDSRYMVRFAMEVNMSGSGEMEYRLVVDEGTGGELVTNEAESRSAWWSTISGQAEITLDSSQHTIKMQARNRQALGSVSARRIRIDVVDLP